KVDRNAGSNPTRRQKYLSNSSKSFEWGSDRIASRDLCRSRAVGSQFFQKMLTGVLMQFTAYAPGTRLQTQGTTGKQDSQLRSSGSSQAQGESASPGYTSAQLSELWNSHRSPATRIWFIRVMHCDRLKLSCFKTALAKFDLRSAEVRKQIAVLLGPGPG